MRLPSLSHLACSLAGCAIVAVATSAAADPAAIVLSSTAQGYDAGDPVAAGAEVSVPDGATVVFLLDTGRLVEVIGPHSGPPSAALPPASAPRASLLRVNAIDESAVGGARSIALEALAPGTSVTVPAGRTTTLCRLPGSGLRLIRGDGLEGPLDLFDADGTRLVSWPAERGSLDLPAELADAATVLRDETGRPRATLDRRTLPEDTAPSRAALALAAEGCTEQARGLVERIRDSVVGLDLSLMSDRGRNPRYRVGDPIHLTARVNRPSHLYCQIRDGAEAVIPIFPPATDPGPVPADRPIEVPGADMPVRLSAGPPPGRTTIRCIAVLPPAVAALPVAASMPTALDDAQVAALDRALAGLPADRWVVESLTLDVVE